jgi:predicted anti-sigma-YlaC factor YlaD
MNAQTDPTLDKRLEEMLTLKLRSLPDHAAPDTLMPRVMAAIAARQNAPWYRQDWTKWPHWAQALLLVLTIGFAAISYLAGAKIWDAVSEPTWLNRIPLPLEALHSSLSFLAPLANGLSLAFKALITQPVFMAFFCIIGFMYFACIGLGSACFRLINNYNRNGL